MAEPFVFHFKPTSDGRIAIMYIADALCRCGLCKHDEIQRFYHATDFHTLVCGTLEACADAIVDKVGYECSNCGTPVGSDHVQKTALTFGFADDSGLIRIFTELTGSAERRYELVPNLRLDPQELPGWAPSEDQGVAVDSLTDACIEAELARPVNLKVAWREIIEDFQEDGEDSWCPLGYGIVAYVAKDSKTLRELVAASRAEDEELSRPEFEQAHFIELVDSTPHELPTREDPESLPGWHDWMGAHLADPLHAGSLAAGALVSSSVVVDVVDRAFAIGRLEASYDQESSTYRAITTPGELTFSGALSVDSVLRRAVYSGLTPGDSARLTAEEIVGDLLRVWHPE